MRGRGADRRSTRDPTNDRTIDADRPRKAAQSVQRWGRPTELQWILGGAVGGVLGGIVTVGLLFAGLGHWTVGAPVLVGAGVGAIFGDRGIRAMIRFMDGLPLP